MGSTTYGWQVLIGCIALIQLSEGDFNGDTNNTKISGKLFDAAEGSGRTQIDCTRRLHTLDGANRKVQEVLNGGKTARILSKCDYKIWKSVREDFLKDAWDQNLQHFHYYLEQQNIASIGRHSTYFEDFCIGCVDEPFLECDQSTGRCKCWRDYETQIENGVTYCRIKIGDFCTVKSLYTRCIKDSFCDRLTLSCQCVVHKEKECGIASIAPPTFHFTHKLTVIAIILQLSLKFILI